MSNLLTPPKRFNFRGRPVHLHVGSYLPGVRGCIPVGACMIEQVLEVPYITNKRTDLEMIDWIVIGAVLSDKIVKVFC